jgi:shikimate kinase
MTGACLTTLLLLTGLRACGKTSLGRLAAEKLGWGFVDTDELAEARIGGSIADLVAERGWEAFRDLESDVLARVCERERLVAATGGGAVLRPANRELMRRAGLVVYLRTEPEVLAERLARDPLPQQRPSLTGRPPAEEMRRLHRERDHLYRECAHHVLDAALTLDELVPKVVALVRAPTT